MEDEVERLRSMLGTADVWKEPKEDKTVTSSNYTQDNPAQNVNILNRSEDDECILSSTHDIDEQREDVLAVGRDVPGMISYGLRFGEKAPMGEKFCPLQAFARFPYQHIISRHQEIVSKLFFANGKLYEREWDFFYVHPPKNLTQKAIVLLPALQVERFLIIINRTLGTGLKLPDAAMDIGLLVDFPIDGTPRPRYLGRADQRVKAEYLKRSAPASTFTPIGEPRGTSSPTDKAMDAFQRRMELLLEYSKNRKAASKAQKRAERNRRDRLWKISVMHVQHYLGIREESSEEELRSSRRTLNVVAKTALNAVNIEIPPQFPPKDYVVFICVDVESYERNHQLVTEIGVATLDVTDILEIAPGKGGENWFEAIHTRHFRIIENANLNNVDFVQGCADRFQFGKSEWISITDVPQEIGKCFREPHSKKSMKKDFKKKNHEEHVQQTLAPKNIILVGHNVEEDIQYLRRIGYDPCNLANLLELVDTVSMYRSFREEDNPRNLGSILADLDIPAWYLHNAGNDAQYTLMAMVGIAFKAVEQKQECKTCNEETQSNRTVAKPTDQEIENDHSSGGEVSVARAL